MGRVIFLAPRCDAPLTCALLWHQLTQQICATCCGPISGSYMEVASNKYHEDCFVCAVRQAKGPRLPGRTEELVPQHWPHTPTLDFIHRRSASCRSARTEGWRRTLCLMASCATITPCQVGWPAVCCSREDRCRGQPPTRRVCRRSFSERQRNVTVVLNLA